MLSGPKMAQLVNEFDTCAAPETNPKSRFHHEAAKGFQAAFHRDVMSLVQVFEDLGNPFDKEGTELTVLDTEVVADEEGASRMRQIEKTGMKQRDTFIKERLIEQKTPLCEPITKEQAFILLDSRQEEVLKGPTAAVIDEERLLPILMLVYRLPDQKW